MDWMVVTPSRRDARWVAQARATAMEIGSERTTNTVAMKPDIVTTRAREPVSCLSFGLLRCSGVGGARSRRAFGLEVQQTGGTGRRFVFGFRIEELGVGRYGAIKLLAQSAISTARR
ncbi:hypothetical protein IMZ48_01025 [Candidatus Bathyarchaeota archaeon]|nr:hypothetical protein [Candidatus Bathyarchaeota archaeon]